jgi:hypothetical protein
MADTLRQPLRQMRLYLIQRLGLPLAERVSIANHILIEDPAEDARFFFASNPGIMVRTLEAHGPHPTLLCTNKILIGDGKTAQNMTDNFHLTKPPQLLSFGEHGTFGCGAGCSWRSLFSF